MAAGGGPVKRTAFVRLATKADVPGIKLLIEGLAEFENLSDQCHATESALESTLFQQPAFSGPTVLILEFAPSPSPAAPDSAQSEETEQIFNEKREEVTFTSDIDDPKAATFRSPKNETRTVVGFVLFFPNYSTFLARPGIYIEDLFVREEYRRQGLGTILLKTVAQQAAKRGFGRVEWSVLDWNVNAIKFYEGMRAIVQQEWRICRLTGDALQAYGK